MALEVSNITDFQKYFDGVMGRADHHADTVNEIILAIVGGVVWRSNVLKTDDIHPPKTGISVHFSCSLP